MSWMGLIVIGLLGMPSVLLADEPQHGSYSVPVWSAIPFLVMLLGIAIFPLTLSHWWHHNRNRAIFSVGLAISVASYLWIRREDTQGASTHDLLEKLEEYFAFLVLLGSLYVISGGIVLRGEIPGKPITNVGILLLGAILANLIGTTGASMVLIRPMLRINAIRKHRFHIPIFFIFIVSNTGGLLTPLGDPPLFLGFLHGVDFFWTLNLWQEWIFVNGLILGLFYLWDRIAYSRESAATLRRERVEFEPLKLEGASINIPCLILILILVLLHSERVTASIGLPRMIFPIGEAFMLSVAAIAFYFTPKTLRQRNDFEWGPILEVAILFLGIFVTMVPALALLKEHGSEIGISQPWQYYWLSGSLSSFLDNAPTYLTFGTLAAEGNSIGSLMDRAPDLLTAISCGSVMMGANTYIGNGPNFMVKAIAEKSGYPMPSFFGYFFYSGIILIPIFILLTLVFMRSV